MSKFGFIQTGNSVTLFFEGKNHTFDKTSAHFVKLTEALNNLAEAYALVTEAKKEFDNV